MAGMLFILFLSACFCLLVFVSWLAARLARRRGRRGWIYGMAVFLTAMGLLFWDWLPMEISYKNKCENEAGLTVYKTPEQWKQENPGAWETLTLLDRYKREYISKNGKLIERRRMNERFSLDTDLIQHWFTVIEERIYIVDMKTNIPMAVYVDFRTNFPFGELKLDSRLLKFWMVKANCKAVSEPLGWKKPKELRERLKIEGDAFYSLIVNFKGGNNK
jgi:hypothetical protein